MLRLQKHITAAMQQIAEFDNEAFEKLAKAAGGSSDLENVADIFGRVFAEPTQDEETNIFVAGRWQVAGRPTCSLVCLHRAVGEHAMFSSKLATLLLHLLLL